MRTRAIALAAMFFPGAALAQNPLGDDSGPNAHDGRCDDTRFENIGAGNSNVVFWEGGRYDGRDATDCRDLLLQGLINWRDGVDPRVDEVLATGDFGDDSGPNAQDGRCDDTRFENIGAGNSNIVFWEGGRYDGRDATDCADLLLRGLIAWRRDAASATVPQVASDPTAPCEGDPEALSLTCLLIVRHDNWGVVETPYVNGRPHGTQVYRWTNGDVAETPYVNGEEHGISIRRNANGRITETPYVNGERHGTEIDRMADGSVIERPYVNGEVHGTLVARYPNGNVGYSCYAYDRRISGDAC